jgi:hypothetical protein
VTNGRLPAGIDGRSPSARRFRDLVRGYEAEFVVASERDRSMINMAATLALKLDEMQEAQLRGQSVDAGELTRLAGQLRRVLAELKQKAAAAVAPPLSLLDHIAASRDDAHVEGYPPTHQNGPPKPERGSGGLLHHPPSQPSSRALSLDIARNRAKLEIEV